jgi:hypothetical protein
MKNCPPDFYNNCSNSIFKCNYCRAGKGKYNNQLYYNPIVNNNLEHPALKITKNRTKSKESKLGRKEEQKIVQSLIKQTINSGSIFNDGDISVGDIKLDSKKRMNSVSFTITKAEYTKGISQNLDGWIITNKDNVRLYALTEKAFIKLVGDLYVNSN